MSKIARNLIASKTSETEPSKTYPVGATLHQIFDDSRDGAKRQAEVSLHHLQTDYIDALLLHELDVVDHGIHYQTRFHEDRIKFHWEPLPCNSFPNTRRLRNAS